MYPYCSPPCWTGAGTVTALPAFRSAESRRKDTPRLLTTEIYLNLSPEHVVEEFQQKW